MFHSLITLLKLIITYRGNSYGLNFNFMTALQKDKKKPKFEKFQEITHQMSRDKKKLTM